jgi:hypothetical protein
VPAADGLRTIRVVDGKPVACYGDDDKACFAFDPVGGAARPHARLAQEADKPDPPGITRDDNEVKICKIGSTTDCRTFKRLKEAGDVEANADRSLVALAGAGSVEVRELATGKLLATIPGWKTPMADEPMIYGVGFIGDHLEVYEPLTPVSASVKLFAPRTGKLIAQAGGPGGEVNGMGTQLDDKTWGWSAFALRRVYLHDIATGKLADTIELGKTVAGEENVGSFLAKIGDHLIVGGNGLYAVDLKTKASKVLAPPACK